MDQTVFLPPHEIHETGEFNTLSQTVGWGLKDLNIPTLWKDAKGENTTIAIIDTGYSPHFETKDSIITEKQKSFVASETIDENGHGTMVCGVVVAKDDMNGIVGVAPNAKIIPIKCIPNSGMFSDINLLINSLRYALELNVDIVNMSLGRYQPFGQEVEQLIQEFYDRNIPVVCAAGNRADKPVMYPANYPTTIGVTSFKKGRSISDFSPSGDNIDFALPGDHIITTTLDDKYAVVSGSSFAAPFMSGIIALMISHYKRINKTYSVEGIIDKLKTKCMKIDGNDKHAQFGYGIINIIDLKELD